MTLRSPRTALAAAVVCFAGLCLTGMLAYLVPTAQVRDGATLAGFTHLNRPRLTESLLGVTHFADPLPYAMIGLALATVAFVRRRLRVGVAIILLLFLTGATTQTLKQGLARPRIYEWLGDGQIDAASWPSGHATASMTLALCAILAASPAWRPTVAAVGALFAIGVSYSILALAWHFPSDVIGGFLVASMWTLLAVAVLTAFPEKRRVPHRSDVRMRGRGSGEGLGEVSSIAPILVLLVVTSACSAVALAALASRPRAATAFAREQPWFVLGALGIAAVATAVAAGLVRATRV